MHVVLIVVVLLALAFDYVNGFHDSANAIATVVSTRALSPRAAVLGSGLLNFVGAFMFESVADTISKGLVDASAVDNHILLAALVGAIFWNVLTWYLGLPSSSTHALVGGLVGAVIISSGMGAVQWDGVWSKVLVPSLVSPVLGLVFGFLIMIGLYWGFRRSLPERVHRRFRHLQVASASLMALSHGTNDAQKTMGLITLALVTAGVQQGFHVAWWVKCLCAGMMALGTAAGGWRIIKTLGVQVAKLDPIHGFAAETAASSLLFANAALGLPVSTTHVISSAIMGVGAARRVKAVRWTVAGRIATAWLLTLPASAAAGGITMLLMRTLMA
jgi:PiT family inorganic phosphate transporter